ncbi:hypothetical protein [Rhizobium leguminosarum]|uniref:hypothetical protein n=1 Tax=Rhizobium leguminosarum TaxID=384 RepID=UPI001C96A1DA|nr:hypothetical protein [Rhizobium leguminosarum]MBY5462075.1 hypothetical protein [Rhizobium leguminosarum]
MSMNMDTIDAIATAFETGVRSISSDLEVILAELVEELAEKHSSGAERLIQPTIAAYADISADGGVGVRLCFGEHEQIQTVPVDAIGVLLDTDTTYDALADEIRRLAPIMSDRDFVVELLHRGRPRLMQRTQEGVAA